MGGPAQTAECGAMARNRKVAVAKAKAKGFAKKDPSGPRRT